MKNLPITLGSTTGDVTITLPEVDDRDLALLEMVAAHFDEASTSVADPYMKIGDPE